MVLNHVYAYTADCLRVIQAESNIVRNQRQAHQKKCQTVVTI